MKIQLILILLVSFFLFFGCTESNYVDLAKMDRSFNIGEGINMPNISLPSFAPNDFVFPKAVYSLTDNNQEMTLFIMDTNFGEQWEAMNDAKQKINFCADSNKCESQDFILTNCYRGYKAGENQNWFYCREMFYRRHINSDGFISPEEILDVNFNIDIRKVLANPIKQNQSIKIDNIIAKEAFGISGVKRDYLEDLIKKQEEAMKK
ncbi:MAG: hypothetical protein PHP82_02075 [Candidatus ainarchaeum sp.]|nr:hypothetical protein [Candidatus ainarchaeum sp.]